MRATAVDKSEEEGASYGVEMKEEGASHGIAGKVRLYVYKRVEACLFVSAGCNQSHVHRYACTLMENGSTAVCRGRRLTSQ